MSLTLKNSLEVGSGVTLSECALHPREERVLEVGTEVLCSRRMLDDEWHMYATGQVSIAAVRTDLGQQRFGLRLELYRVNGILAQVAVSAAAIEDGFKVKCGLVQPVVLARLLPEDAYAIASDAASELIEEFHGVLFWSADGARLSKSVLIWHGKKRADVKVIVNRLVVEADEVLVLAYDAFVAVGAKPAVFHATVEDDR